MAEHLGFAPEILRRLGEELVPHPDQGIVELARNSYDADATTCKVELVNTDTSGGTVIITDDGDGMDYQSISDGWLILGRSSKSKALTTRLGRIPAGDKGLGRLAALRLGSSAVLETRPISEPGVQYQLELNWADFEAAKVVEDVPLQIVRSTTTRPHGTTIELRNLRVRLRRGDVDRLARALILLSDPFESKLGFRPELITAEFADLERRVRNAYFDEIQYRIEASLDDHGQAHARILDWKGDTLHSGGHERIARPRGGAYLSPPAVFDLWAFNLAAGSFTARAAGVTEVRNWLATVGGVHIYHQDLRVPPYGDRGFDWLDMNLRRARSPESRPSTNTSVGRVSVQDSQQLLTQKTDRTGFVENDAFLELRRFCMDTLDWAARELLHEAEKRRRAERKKADERARATRNDVETVRSSLQESAGPEANAAFIRYQKAIERQLRALAEDVQLYRTLGTVGTTTSAFAHESVKPAGRIEQAAKLIRSRGKREYGSSFEEKVGNQINAVLKAAKALGRWARLPLNLLQREKRRAGRLNLQDVISDVLLLLEPFMVEAGIGLHREIDSTQLPVHAAASSVESIVANLVINSINAIVGQTGSSGERLVRVQCGAREDGFAVLVVSDSGPGIQGIDPEDIWLPGRTTRSHGTGLGLTIVRDSVADLGGSVSVLPSGSLGGAEFTILIPMLETSE